MDLFNIHIAICDDEEEIGKLLKRIVDNVLERQEIQGKVECFTVGYDLLKRVEEFDLVFLDMDMPEMDGIEVGIHIGQCNPKCRIIIASGREDRFKETYDILPLRFISKPFDEDEVWEAIQAYIDRQIGYEALKMYKERELCVFPQREIQYIAACKSGVEIYVDGQLYRQYVTLSKIEPFLDKRLFVKVHRSYIVNLCSVKKIQEAEIIVGNGVVIPIARRNRKEFQEAYRQYDVNYR